MILRVAGIYGPDKLPLERLRRQVPGRDQAVAVVVDHFHGAVDGIGNPFHVGDGKLDEVVLAVENSIRLPRLRRVRAFQELGRPVHVGDFEQEDARDADSLYRLLADDVEASGKLLMVR